MVDDPQQVIDAAAIVAEIAYSEFTHAEKSYHFKRVGLPPQHVRMGVPIAKSVPARPGSRRRRRYTRCSRRRPRRSTGGGSRAAPRAAAPSARRPRASPRAPLQLPWSVKNTGCSGTKLELQCGLRNSSWVL